jgi:translation initiation factor 3 subunit J
MDDEWDADNFDPGDIKTAPSVGANKWEGEDEDEDVKDNWEDEEEEEKKDVEKQEPAKPAQQKKSKKIIEEKDERLHEEAETKEQERETEEGLTTEEIQKLQEEDDLRVAMETFGVAETSTALGIDAMNPSTREEFDELQAAISKKVQSFAKSPHFPAFAEELFRNICVNLTSHDLKKLKTTVENMFLEKSKAEKGDKTKKSKGKGKVKLKVEGDHALVNEYSYGDYDDYDDFM